MRSHAARLAFTAAALAPVSIAQSPFTTFSGENEGDSLGVALAAVGDLDGDGVLEIAIGAPGKESASTQTPGELQLYSGATQALLGVATGDLGGVRFGASVTGDVDLSGDGVPDLVVGSPGGDTVTALNGAALAAGAQAELWTYQGELGGQVGRAVAMAEDLDGDGVAEVAVGEPLAGGDTPGFGPGRVAILSGSTGTAIDAIESPDEGPSAFGWSLARVQDDDGDGIDEWVVGAPAADGRATRTGAVHVVDGASTRITASVRGVIEDGELGLAVAAGPVLDGRPTFFAGAPASVATPEVPGAVLWITAAGEVHEVFEGRDPGARFGWALEPVSSRTLAIGEPASVTLDDRPGSVHLVELDRGGWTTIRGEQPGGEFGRSLEWFSTLRVVSFQGLGVGSPSFDETLDGDQGGVKIFAATSPN